MKIAKGFSFANSTCITKSASCSNPSTGNDWRFYKKNQQRNRKEYTVSDKDSCQQKAADNYHDTITVTEKREKNNCYSWKGGCNCTGSHNCDSLWGKDDSSGYPWNFWYK